MDIEIAKKVVTIAKDIRKKCERYAQSIKSQTKHYHEQDDLRCMCATASAVLFEALKATGIQSNMCNGHFVTGEEGEDLQVVNHCWVELDGKIIDLTATQFGIDDKIYIVDDMITKYIKKNDIPNWREMTWQKPQRPTEKIVSDILNPQTSALQKTDIQESFQKIHQALMNF